jgi:hypothetical protein
VPDSPAGCCSSHHRGGLAVRSELVRSAVKDHPLGHHLREIGLLMGWDQGDYS